MENMSLHNYDEEEIRNHAKEWYNMVDKQEALNSCNLEEITDYLENNYGTVITKPFFYPNNSIRVSLAYGKLLENIGKIPIEKIEELIKNL